MELNKIKMAIIGQGRSGRDIHGEWLHSEQNDLYEVVAIVEADADRRVRAAQEWPGAKILADYTELFAMKDEVELVVNASYSQDHYPITKDLLEHDFNVLVEKPFGANRYECNNLMRIAKERKLMLAVFQQTLLSPMYMIAKEYAQSGKLGKIQQISIRYNGFSRRWDWQTLQCCVAGGIYNTGPHPLGFALGFLDFDEDTRVIYSKLANTDMCSGDSDDYAKVLLTAPGKPLVDVEISSIDAFNDFNIKIQGNKGTFKAKVAGEYWAKYIEDGANPERPVSKTFISKEDGTPAYCGEQLVAVEEHETFNNNFMVYSDNFYRMLYKHMRLWNPLTIKPEYAAQVISVIETVHAQNPLPVKFGFDKE